MVCERRVPFRCPLTSKVQCISGSPSFSLDDQWPAPPFNISLHPASGGKRSLVDNTLTKYQMITFIDFCEVWFLPESVARVAAIVGDPHAPALIQRDFGCVHGVQQTKQLPHISKIDLVWLLGV
ncbi:hypothetical protein TNCV_2576211 [Trichonephila clavipes]|uniref:Uncharacterized protein n=1 Tax=Trichonephila clavipes TaxID=2585209 RepID=A0A8X6RB58_TRICX|nr:hypothetical protein TNCV_2576211 [Trichonephila clavipes]